MKTTGLAKIMRLALQNAASIASLILATGCYVVDWPAVVENNQAATAPEVGMSC